MNIVVVISMLFMAYNEQATWGGWSLVLAFMSGLLAMITAINALNKLDKA